MEDKKFKQNIQQQSAYPILTIIEGEIMKQNQGLVNRISRVYKKIDCRRVSQNNQKTKFKEITKNIQAMFQINRTSRSKNIQLQNRKMFCRLVNTSPTLSRKSWRKVDEDNKKYKLNISRTRYVKPDYSEEVCRIIKNQKVTYKHLKIWNTRDYLPNVSRLKKSGTSENFRQVVGDHENTIKNNKDAQNSNLQNTVKDYSRNQKASITSIRF